MNNYVSMIVSLSGPQSTGKTTLFNHLKQVLPVQLPSVNFHFMEEDARVIWEELKLKYQSFESFIDKHGYGLWQFLIYKKSVETLETAIELVTNCSKPTVVVLDRSILDCIVYTQLLLDYNDEYYKRIMSGCRDHLHKIDLFLFTTPLYDSAFEEDELRIVFRNNYLKEVMFFELFHYLGEVLPTSMDERVKVATKVIASKLNEKSYSYIQSSSVANYL